jgi:hypothetical protein
MEAQLLGQPLPAGVPGAAAGTPVPQVFTTTDADGRFVFQNLAPGRFQIRAQREGYFAAPASGVLVPPAIVNVAATVAAGQPTPPVTISMLRGATISGRVRDPSGQPVSNLQVMAQQWTYRDGKPALQQVNSKTTDDRGEFRLFWLPPGDYLVGINPPRPATAPRPTDAYARTWFPNAAEPRFAPRVAVAEGAEIAGIDISIRPQSPVSVSGQIVSGLTGPNGQPGIPQPTLFLLPRNADAVIDTLAPNYPNVVPVQNRNSGQFEIRGVPPGSYDLVAMAPDSNGRPMPGRAPIEVGFSNVDNVTIAIRPGVQVRARVFLDGNPVMSAPPISTSAVAGLPARAAVSSITVSPSATVITSTDGGVTFLPAGTVPPPPPAGGAGTTAIRIALRSRESYAPPFDTAASAGMTTDASGAFVFPNVPEALYTVQVSGLPANSYVADIREGGVSIYDSGLRVTSGAPAEIEVHVASKGATLEGTVMNAVKMPAENATVVLVPAAPRRGNPALYKMGRSLAQGAFRLSGIAPGDYKLFAWESIPPTAYMNAEYLAQYENRGIPITIGAGSSLQADVPLIAN